jgi:RNA polymerase sigma-70 factor (ECF subfamily)
MVELTMPPIWSNLATELFPSRTAEAATSESTASINHEVLCLFDSLRMRLLRFTIAMGLSVHDGEDIIQEVFLALFHHLLQGRSRSNLHGWVFRVTHNLALKRRMKNQNEKSVTEDDYRFAMECSDSSPNPEEQIVLNERQAHLHAILRALPENDQLCLRLRAEGMRYREISKILGMSLGSVSTSLTRSLDRLARVNKR